MGHSPPALSTMQFSALLLSCLAAATAPSTPVKAASPYYTPPVYSEVSYAPPHHHGYVKPGHVFTGYNNQYNTGYNTGYNGYNGHQAFQGYNNYNHGHASPYYNNLVLKKN